MHSDEEEAENNIWRGLVVIVFNSPDAGEE